MRSNTLLILNIVPGIRDFLTNRKVMELASGVWTGRGRLFEVAFVVLWCLGAINHVALDFMGVTGTAIAMLIPLAYGIAAVALLFLACVGRQRQFQE